jgi:hypothetical protein
VSVPPSSTPPGKSSFRPIAITLLVGALLAGGSCFGFFFQIASYDSQIATLTVAGIMLGAAVFVAGLVLTIIWVVKRVFRGAQEKS